MLVLGVGGRAENLTAVAILAGPGGPVLASGPRAGHRLRSSCDPRRPRRAGAGFVLLPRHGYPGGNVAILADPGGPVLVTPSRHYHADVPEGCDPRRPRRAGAGWYAYLRVGRHGLLRSSPAPEGRCWPGVLLTVGQPHVAVAILAGPGGPVLAGAGAARRPGACRVAILAGPGGPVLVAVEHVPGGDHDGVAILAGPGGPVLGRRALAAPTVPALLRSSPAPEGRCWPRCARRSRTQRRQGCDPRRPRRAGAGG